MHVDIVEFVSKLCRLYRKQDLLVIWNGAAIRSSERMKALFKECPDRAYIEHLPVYSPELNLVELLWNQVN